MKPHHQITSADRYTLSLLRKRRLGQAAIARVLGHNPSTISREIRRNPCASDGQSCKAEEECHVPCCSALHCKLDLRTR